VLSTLGLYRITEPQMVKVPAGEFLMGSGDDDSEAAPEEKPLHGVVIDKPFAIGKYEVIFEEYDQFAYATGRTLPADQGRGRGRFPVINVSWGDAVAYAQWLSKMTDKGYRLPTEAEWEYAARAGTRTFRFWGDNRNQSCRYANVADQSYAKNYPGKTHDCNDGHVFTAEVGAFEANRFGLHDMLGNVWEWVRDCAHPNYVDAPTDGSVWLTGDCARRVIRSGSWFNDPGSARSADRYWNDPGNRDDDLGFRLAQDF
jgi:formylglycine-generating enzyme required for sulfatase activity